MLNTSFVFSIHTNYGGDQGPVQLQMEGAITHAAGSGSQLNSNETQAVNMMEGGKLN